MLKKILSNKKTIVIFIVTLIFGVAAYFFYKTYVIPKIEAKYVENKEFVTTDNDEINNEHNPDMYFFYTSWCPHCKTAFPIWNQLKKKYNNINFIEVDCDEDTQTADKFKIDGYPTIKLVKNNKIIEYDAKPELETLIKFIQSS